MGGLANITPAVEHVRRRDELYSDAFADEVEHILERHVAHDVAHQPLVVFDDEDQELLPTDFIRRGVDPDRLAVDHEVRQPFVRLRLGHGADAVEEVGFVRRQELDLPYVVDAVDQVVPILALRGHDLLQHAARELGGLDIGRGFVAFRGGQPLDRVGIELHESGRLRAGGEACRQYRGDQNYLFHKATFYQPIPMVHTRISGPRPVLKSRVGV